MKVNSNGYNGWYCAHCRCGVDPSEVTYHETHTVCGRYITDDEPPKGLTDLEIVQRALEKTGLDMSADSLGIYLSTLVSVGYETDTKYLHSFKNSDELLTWAKQTIGDQS